MQLRIKRNWPGVEHARELAAEDLDEIYEIDMKMKYLITRRTDTSEYFSSEMI